MFFDWKIQLENVQLTRDLKDDPRINGNDTQYTEWSTDVKLFPLSYNSQITATLGLLPYEMVFNQKPRKTIMYKGNSSKKAQGYFTKEFH